MRRPKGIIIQHPFTADEMELKKKERKTGERAYRLLPRIKKLNWTEEKRMKNPNINARAWAHLPSLFEFNGCIALLLQCRIFSDPQFIGSILISILFRLFSKIHRILSWVLSIEWPHRNALHWPIRLYGLSSCLPAMHSGVFAPCVVVGFLFFVPPRSQPIHNLL